MEDFGIKALEMTKEALNGLTEVGKYSFEQLVRLEFAQGVAGLSISVFVIVALLSAAIFIHKIQMRRPDLNSFDEDERLVILSIMWAVVITVVLLMLFPLYDSLLSIFASEGMVIKDLVTAAMGG